MKKLIWACVVLIFAALSFVACGRRAAEILLFPHDASKIFAWQNALPVDAVGGTRLSFILLEGGGLWAFGWHYDGNQMAYAQTPFFVADDVDDIFVENGVIFAIIHGETKELGGHKNDLELELTNGEIWAKGKFFQGHSVRGGIIYTHLPQPTKIWSAEMGFIPKQWILAGQWSIVSSSDMIFDDKCCLTFYKDGMRIFCDAPDVSEQWSIMANGRLKIEQTHDYEVFDIRIFRDQNSMGVFDRLTLSNSDLYINFLRVR